MMMVKNNMHARVLLTIFLFTGVFISGKTAAMESHNVQVIIQGTIAGSTCTVLNDTQSINLGAVGVAVLGTSNSAWVWVPVTISLEHCPVGMGKAQITFSGETDPNNGLYYKNTAVKGSGSDDVAQNVAIEVAQTVGYDILSNGTKMTALISKETHKAQFDLQARMITPTGRASAGKVSGHIDYTIEYQ